MENRPLPCHALEQFKTVQFKLRLVRKSPIEAWLWSPNSRGHSSLRQIIV